MARWAPGRHRAGFAAVSTGCILVLALSLVGCAGYVSSAGGSGNPGTNPAPIITGVTAGSPTSTGTTISWTTNVPCTSTVNYGTTASYGQSTALNSNLVTSHSAGLSGLTPSTLYHFQVVSKDSSGTQTTSADYTFTTAASTTPPTISGVTVGGITSSGATITWTTNIGATSQVNYGTTTSYGQSSVLNSSLVTSHSVALSGLSASTLYHYQVISKDGNGNQATSADFTFTTASAAPPVISAVTATNLTSSGSTITWTTDVGATSQVNYGTTSSYGQSSTLNSNLVTSHSVALSGLTGFTTYHYQVVSKNSGGIQATSGDFTFTTASSTPPTISGISAINITVTGATITWTTNVGATSQVNYGTTTSYGQSSALNSSLVTSHSVALSALAPLTLYHYQVVSTDANGNQATSADSTFTTLADTIAPSVPAGLSATAVSSSQINLTWIASTDDVAVTGYKVFRGGSQVGISTVASYSDKGLSASTTYSYNVEAYDAAGNVSAQSSAATATTMPQVTGGTCAGGMPCTLGWYDIPGSSPQSANVCPSYSNIDLAEGCKENVAAYGTAAIDTNRNHYVISSGGHTDYGGNGIYAFDLNQNPPAWMMVKAPYHGSDAATTINACGESFSDGSPNSRHNEDGFFYWPTQDTYEYAGFGLANCGNFSNGQWEFNPVTATWGANLNVGQSTYPNLAKDGSVPIQAYDPVTDKIYMWQVNSNKFWSYSRASNTWTLLKTQFGGGCDKASAGATIDPARRLYICGSEGELRTVSLNPPYTSTILDNAPNCSGWTNPNTANHGPGMAWDPVQQLTIGWSGGNNVYTFDGTSCAVVTPAGNGPPSPPGNDPNTTQPYPANSQQGDGTFNRLAYIPSLGGFLLLNDWSQDVWFLRLTDTSSAAQQDFTNRCNAAGVIVCDGFDSQSVLPQRPCSGADYGKSGLYVDCFDNTSTVMTLDTTKYRSGGGSILATIPSIAGSNPTGTWLRYFNNNLNTVGTTESNNTIFGQNSDLYFSFAQRMDSAFLTNQWPQQGGGLTYFKQHITAWAGSSCGQTDLVTVNIFNSGFPLNYSQCGQLPFQKTVGGTVYDEFTQSLVTGQTGWKGYDCPYGSAQPNANCFDYSAHANEWVTYYFHIHIGTWGSPNSLVESWVSTPSSPGWRQWNYMNNLTYNLDPGSQGFDVIHLLAYWTRRDNTISAGPVSHTWYDELIVSSQPIAPPQAPPAAP